jgi:hypothetical protein
MDLEPVRRLTEFMASSGHALLGRWKPMIEYYKVRPHNPCMPGCSDWLAAQGTPFKD